MRSLESSNCNFDTFIFETYIYWKFFGTCLSYRFCKVQMFALENFVKNQYKNKSKNKPAEKDDTDWLIHYTTAILKEKLFGKLAYVKQQEKYFKNDYNN